MAQPGPGVGLVPGAFITPPQPGPGAFIGPGQVGPAPLRRSTRVTRPTQFYGRPRQRLILTQPRAPNPLHYGDYASMTKPQLLNLLRARNQWTARQLRYPVHVLKVTAMIEPRPHYEVQPLDQLQRTLVARGRNGNHIGMQALVRRCRDEWDFTMMTDRQLRNMLVARMPGFLGWPDRVRSMTRGELLVEARTSEPNQVVGNPYFDNRHQ